MRKVLKDNGDLAFRIQLAKSSLQIDTTPTEASVMTFAHHLLAEVEQVAHQDRRRKDEKPLSSEPKVKKLEEGKGDGKGGARERLGGAPPCKFFLTEGGCKKGKTCTWPHDLDDQRRCWTCGSTQHFSPACDRPREALKEGAKGGFERGAGAGKGGEGKGGKPSVKQVRKEEGLGEEVCGRDEGVEDPASSETVKGLLEEANRMLKALSGTKAGENAERAKVDRLAAMQTQLDELRKMKTLRLSRISREEQKYALLDSGATHPMRGAREGEDLGAYELVKVTLADGHQVDMRMTSSGVMITDQENVEPIVPMSLLAGRLGYTISWEKGQMKVRHPQRGDIRVRIANGCPQISRVVALQLIAEVEAEIGLRSLNVVSREKEWLQGLVQAHPALRDLPEVVKQRLVVSPDLDLRRIPGCNRRKRRTLEREGFVVHLYAGPDEGYTLSRALKEVGGDPQRLVEVDILREGSASGSHNMLSDHGPYPALVRAALDGSLKGLVMGPNCRTRSVLRHYPRPDWPGGGPVPVRSWSEPWGKSTNSEEDQKKVENDDVLMWRGLMLYVIQEEVRRAVGGSDGEKMILSVEQPADPTHYMPEVVTFWKTEPWIRMRQRYDLWHQTFNQGRFGGAAEKPTTFAGNLLLNLVESHQQDGEGEVRRAETAYSSRDLARWAPGVMREIATQLQKVVFQRKVRFMKLSWEEHVQRGHTPFRRDCQVCQEAAARGRRHFAIEHPRAGVMSLDVVGPLCRGHDLEMDTKFLLVGTYTWLLPPGAEEDKEPLEEVEPEDQAPPLHDDEEEEAVHLEVDEGDDEEGEQRADEELVLPVEEPRGIEERVSPKVEVIRIGVPVAGKSEEAVLAGMIELYLQLRVDGFPVHTIHTDRGREFTGKRARAWMRSRSITQSTTGGEDPQANGRVEKAAGEIKKRLRRMLHGSNMGPEWWPMAMRYAMETDRLARRGEVKQIPGFAQKILIKKRIWRTKALEPTHEEAWYLTPLVECHGHCVLRGEGRWGIAPYIIRNVDRPPPPTEDMWLAIVEELEKDEIAERRKIRGKQPIRHGGSVMLMNIQRMLKEEAASMDVDRTENAVATYKKMEPWRVILKKVECEEEEILQTKIVGVDEMVRDLPLWDEAIRSELNSLFEKKGALRRVYREEREQIRKSHPDVVPLPAKLVVTRKAGGKRKIRIVACGNFAAKQEGEDLYASGSDTISLRLALRKAVEMGWEGVTADVRTAFLNAPLTGAAEEDPDNVVLIAPPRLLIRLGYARSDETWMAIKAMYGLRQSPKAWGDYRDAVISRMEWLDEGVVMVFQALVTDPNVWKIVAITEEVTEDVRGIMLVYVDDLMILGRRVTVESCLRRIAEEWELSTPEWLNSRNAVRFLGMGILRDERGIFLGQEDYIRDLMQKNGEENGHCSGVPITKEQVGRLEEEEGEKDAECVRMAQKATGELMWVGTRTRPDLMYTLSCMSRYTLKNPAVVIEIGAQARKYLRKTISEGIHLQRGEHCDLEVYSDSSYGPGGMDSQGTVIVTWGGSPIMWKAGRQGVPCLSTAESELGEAIEGVIMGDAVDCMVQEIAGGRYGRIIKIDNQAAVNLMTEPSGSWRTRHLRLRASHMRWRLGRADWLAIAIPGSLQLADIGTKVMTAPKLKEMRQMMMVEDRKTLEKEEVVPEEEVNRCGKENGGGASGPEEAIERATRMIQLAVLLGEVTGVRSEVLGSDERDGMEWTFVVLIILAGIGVLSLAHGVWSLGERWCRSRGMRGTEVREEKLQSPVHGGSEPGSERRESLESEGTGQSASPVREEPRVVDEASPRRGGPRGRREVGEGSRRSERSLNPDVDSSLWRRSRVIITPWGERYHGDPECPTLNQTRRIRFSPWCQACAVTHEHRGRVYAVGPGKVVHVREDCPRIDRLAVAYQRCAVCSQREERLEQARP